MDIDRASDISCIAVLCFLVSIIAVCFVMRIREIFQELSSSGLEESEWEKRMRLSGDGVLDSGKMGIYVYELDIQVVLDPPRGSERN